MEFEPDILVTTPEPTEFLLVASAKTSFSSITDAERGLKSYMTGTRSEVGLLVTPEQVRMYQEKYRPVFGDSIEKVGDFDAKDVFRFGRSGNTASDAAAFEDRVQLWLEGLANDSGYRGMTPEFREAVETYIVPILLEGSVRAAHPRYR